MLLDNLYILHLMTSCWRVVENLRTKVHANHGLPAGAKICTRDLWGESTHIYRSGLGVPFTRLGYSGYRMHSLFMLLRLEFVSS